MPNLTAPKQNTTPMAKSDDNKTKMVQPTPAPGAQPQEAKPTQFPSNIPTVESDDANIPQVNGPTQPDYSKFSGSYKKDDDGLVYALAVVNDDPLGRTHKALNSLRFWEGTAREFRDQFQVSENDKRVQDGTESEDAKIAERDAKGSPDRA